MDTPSYSLAVDPPPPTFIGLAYSLSGWTLIEIALLSQGIGIRAHLIPTLMALFLIFNSIKGMKLSPQLVPTRQASEFPKRNNSIAAETGWATLLFMVGTLIGILVLCSFALLGLVASTLTFIPWRRIAFCRDRILAASLLMCIGISLPLLVDRSSIIPLFLPISAWILWLCATFSILNRIIQLWQAERTIKAVNQSLSNLHA